MKQALHKPHIKHRSYSGSTRQWTSYHHYQSCLTKTSSHISPLYCGKLGGTVKKEQIYQMSPLPFIPFLPYHGLFSGVLAKEEPFSKQANTRQIPTCSALAAILLRWGVVGSSGANSFYSQWLRSFLYLTAAILGPLPVVQSPRGFIANSNTDHLTPVKTILLVNWWGLLAFQKPNYSSSTFLFSLPPFLFQIPWTNMVTNKTKPVMSWLWPLMSQKCLQTNTCGLFHSVWFAPLLPIPILQYKQQQNLK